MPGDQHLNEAGRAKQSATTTRYPTALLGTWVPASTSSNSDVRIQQRRAARSRLGKPIPAMVEAPRTHRRQLAVVSLLVSRDDGDTY